MSEKHTQGLISAFDNAGATMQSYSQSSGLHGIGDKRLQLIAGCFKDIGGEEVAAANARRLAACWNAFQGISTEDIENSEPMLIMLTRKARESAALEQESRGYRLKIAELDAQLGKRPCQNKRCTDMAAARALLADILFNDGDNQESALGASMTERIREFLKGGA